MSNNTGLNREGDLNTSLQRQEWIQQLPAKTRDGLQADAAVFVKQALSTPCMNQVIDADGCYLTDQSGKHYLDFHGNSVHQIGYKNPYVIEAVRAQLSELPFVPRRYTADIVVQAAQMLIDKTTSGDYVALLTPSGAAAIGIALKIVRKVTGRHKVMSLWESFHGAGLDSISVGGEYAFSKDMGPLLPGCIKTLPYNAYRNLIHSNCPERVSEFCLDHLEYIIANEGDIGAMLLEPIRATDTHIPPQSYFARLRRICDQHGILLIFDEIPTALGRSGAFYVHQNFGVEPDILVLGKGLGGAVIPQAAVLVRKKHDVAPDISLGHYTHEKPAAGAAAICATIRYIEAMDLLENCRRQSECAKQYAATLYEKFACIGDIRIIGLLITFEIVTDRQSKQKDEALAEKIFYYCLQHGLSFKLSAGNCITWHPPLIVTRAQLAFAFTLLKEAIAHCSTNC